MGVFSDTCVVFLCGFVRFCVVFCCVPWCCAGWYGIPAGCAGGWCTMRSGRGRGYGGEGWRRECRDAGVQGWRPLGVLSVVLLMPVCVDVRAVFARVPGCAGPLLLTGCLLRESIDIRAQRFGSFMNVRLVRGCR